MNAVIKKITNLINAEEDAVKCAAVRVLGELGVKEKAVVKLLGEKLVQESDAVKLAILDSFIRNPQTAALPYLLPLLKLNGNLRLKVIHAVAAIGPQAISTLEKEFKSATLVEKKLFIDILSTLRSKATVDFLVRSLVGGDLELLKYICFSLRNQLEKMQRPEKLYLLEKVDKFLQLEAVKKNDEMTTSGVLLLGFIGETQVKKNLLKFFDRKRSFYVRRNALISLARLNLSGAGHEDVAEEVFPLLNDPDFPNVVRNALAVLEKINLPRRFAAQLPKLLETTRHPAVKRFALTRLAALGNKSTIQLMISHLDSNDPMVRDAACEALGGLPRAVPELQKKLEATRELDKGEKIALILRKHKDYFTRERARSIYVKLEKSLAKGDEQHRIFSLLLKHVHPDYFYAETLKKARQVKRAKKFESSKKYLDLLATGLFYTDDVRYELASVLLKLSKKDLTSATRSEDPALNLFSALARVNLGNLIKQVKADRSLDVNDLYYLGFHFSERQFEQKAFGVEVLKHLLKKFPRAKVKSAAKKKLQLAGPVAAAKESAFASSSREPRPALTAVR
ncbi:MAG: HEAT repeat domain-containing protein [Candidatus Omnitrophica bacterium]|nr:HEAT repeat domain-containing protein [Candidatus Omnitrophota bacterium]